MPLIFVVAVPLLKHKSEGRNDKLFLGRSGGSMGKSRGLVHQWHGFKSHEVHETFWMPFRSAAVSHVLGHGVSPPLNPVVENTIFTLRTDTDSNES